MYEDKSLDNLAEKIRGTDKKNSEIPLLTEEEERMILIERNDTQIAYPTDKTIRELFEEQVRKTPDNNAVSFPLDLNDIYEELASDKTEVNNLKKLQNCCFAKSKYLYESGFETSAVKGNIKILKTIKHNSVLVNNNTFKLICLFNGKKNLRSIFSALEEPNLRFLVFPIRTKDILEITYDFSDKMEIFSNGGFEDFVSLVKALYKNNLIDLVDFRSGQPKADVDSRINIQFDKYKSTEAKIDWNYILNRNKQLFKVDILLLGDTPGMASTGILYLASYLRRNGIKSICQFYDSSVDFASMKRNVEELLNATQPRFVGISLKWFLYIARMLDICKIIKEFSMRNSLDIKIILGGNTASYYYEDFARNEDIDYIIRGDGELPLLKICRGEEDIPNCIRRKDGRIVENQISYVQDEVSSSEIYLSHLDEILISDYASLFGTFFIYTHKGCVMNCFYCGGCNEVQKKTFNRKRVLRRAEEEVKKDIIEAKKYTSTFMFDFDIPAERLSEYCKKIWQGIDLSSHFCIVNNIKLPSPDLVKLTCKTFKYVYCDIDVCTLSERHRKQLVSFGMVKPLPNDEEILSFFDECEKYDNLEIRINLITGLPYFTAADIEPGDKLLFHIMNTYSRFGELHWARLHGQPGASIIETAEDYNMHSAATTYEDFLKCSDLNFNRKLSYAQLDYFNYPYIYFKDEKLNSRISQHYSETTRRISQYRKKKKRDLLVCESLTYKELNQQSNRLARTLREKGVKAGSIVAIMVEPSLEMMVSILGVLKAGGGFLPIDPQYPSGRISFMLEDSQSKILLTQKDLLDKVKFDGEILNIREKTVYALNGSNLAKISTNSDTVYVIYTSGTTGKPKGVLIKNESLTNYTAWFARSADLSQKDKTILTSSYAFDLGYTSIFPSILSGAELNIVPKEIYLSIEGLCNYIKKRGISYIKVTPSLLSAVVNSAIFSTNVFAGLRLVVVGGEPINARDIEKLHKVCSQVKVMNHYGPTEATIGCISQLIDFNKFSDYKGHPTIGRPIDNTRAYILDRNLRPVPVGVPGELAISGPGLAKGYLNRPDLTAERFVPSPHNPQEMIYRTGDLARWLPDGNIECLGRMDKQVKIKGFRIELGEIEGQLKNHKQIREAVVIDRVDKNGRKYLCAYLVPQNHRIKRHAAIREEAGPKADKKLEHKPGKFGDNKEAKARPLCVKDIGIQGKPAALANKYLRFAREDLNQSIVSRFESQVEKYGNKTAVRSNGRILTYDSLNQSANRLANLILEKYDDRFRLSQKEKIRYRRQMLLHGWGIEAQEKLKRTTVFVAGAGGGASPTITQLALIGLGTIIVCDSDIVELSNLNRQFLHDESRLGMNKALSAKMTVNRINPHVNVITHTEKLTRENVFDLVGDASVIFDMLDDQMDKFILSECAVVKGIPHVISAMIDINSYSAIFHTPYSACFHCIFNKDKLDVLIRGMKNVIDGYKKNPLAVVSSSLFTSTGFAVNEAIKVILGFKNPSYNRFFYFNQSGTEEITKAGSYISMTYGFSDHFRELSKKQGFDWDKGWRANFLEELKLERDPNCPVCSEEGRRVLLEKYKMDSASGTKISAADAKTQNRPLGHCTPQNDKKQTVALLLDHDSDMAVGIMGVIKSGKIYVLLDADLAEDKLLYMLGDSVARLIVTNSVNLKLSEKLRDRINKNISIINIDEIDKTGNIANPGLKLAPDLPAGVLYSSDSIEAPQGIMYSHRNILHITATYTNNLHIDSNDRLLSVIHHSHYASIVDIFGSLLNGASLHPYKVKKETGIIRLADFLAKEKITIYHSTPAIYRSFTANLAGNEEFADTRIVVVDGEAVYKYDFEQYKRYFPDHSLFMTGLGTDLSPLILHYSVDKRTPLGDGSILVGFSVERTEAFIVNKNNGEALINEVGEIVSKSSFKMPEFWNNVEKLAEVFVNDSAPNGERLYRSGYLGKRLPDGSIERVGRKNKQTGINENLIVSRLLKYEGIDDVVMVERDLDCDNRQLCAYFVSNKKLAIPTLREYLAEEFSEDMIPLFFTRLKEMPLTSGGNIDVHMLPTPEVVAEREDRELTDSALRDYLSRELPDYMIPTHFVVIEEIPLTPNGKVDKRALPEPKPAGHGPEAEKEFIAPRNDIEKTIAQIWEKYLEAENIGIHDDFFELGGNSLLCMQVIAELQQAGIMINVGQFLENPTIADLAILIH